MSSSSPDPESNESLILQINKLGLPIPKPLLNIIFMKHAFSKFDMCISDYDKEHTNIPTYDYFYKNHLSDNAKNIIDFLSKKTLYMLYTDYVLDNYELPQNFNVYSINNINDPSDPYIINSSRYDVSSAYTQINNHLKYLIAEQRDNILQEIKDGTNCYLYARSFEMNVHCGIRDNIIKPLYSQLLYPNEYVINIDSIMSNFFENKKDALLTECLNPPSLVDFNKVCKYIRTVEKFNLFKAVKNIPWTESHEVVKKRIELQKKLNRPCVFISHQQC
jgi:hypothetical protein